MSATAVKSRVVLTRPQGKNEALAERLSRAGLPALLLPALRIRPLAPGAAHTPAPEEYDLLVFVSGHALQFYLQALAQCGDGQAWPRHTLAATVGGASARMLEDTGFIPSSQIIYPGPDVNQDSESLWRLLQPHLAGMKRVLIVRGQTGREWLGARLEKAGLEVHRLAMYERMPVQWDRQQAEQLAQILDQPEPCVFLLTSSESLDAVHNNIRRVGLEQTWARSRFVVIHERIARRLQSSLQASGKVEAPMVKICQPGDDTIFQMITLAAAL
ncbi:uroporphyrinogen-III synthase [Alcaligenaceae bacterium]|nr:uroporphyrinogen-III synthase [Alcaligenaceae bacterium]